eukprot:780041-Alexandrium_andersonii.AAC.1
MDFLGFRRGGMKFTAARRTDFGADRSASTRAHLARSGGRRQRLALTFQLVLAGVGWAGVL